MKVCHLSKPFFTILYKFRIPFNYMLYILKKRGKVGYPKEKNENQSWLNFGIIIILIIINYYKLLLILLIIIIIFYISIIYVYE